MRHHRLFAAGVSVALLLGAATPAMAKQPNKGKAYGHQNNTPADSRPAKPKPAKPDKTPATPKPKAGVSGGGSLTGGSFAVQARQSRFAKGHFNYTSTDEKFKVRCQDFHPNASDPNADSLTITGTKAVLWAKCATLAPKHARTPIWVEATFTDNGDSTESATPGPKDNVVFKFFSHAEDRNSTTTTPAETYSGDLTGGNVKVR